MGGDLTGGADGRTLQFGVPRGDEGVLEDDRVRVSIRMTVGGESKAFRPQSGEITSERQRLDEHAATFNADFGDSGDYLAGCFHAFPLEHTFTQEISSDVR
jgi:hypothetical protein